MSSLQQAQTALQQLITQRNDRYYPNYHLAPPAGWMNDPNGLIYHAGVYHAFYQHHPYSESWGPMHWGHATSTDMLHWQHQPIALAPEYSYEADGCFSGSAVINEAGQLCLIYTGHQWLAEIGDDSAIQQVQCLATSEDGIHFTKQGVILTAPPHIMHFRDPKVWRQDGYWWMVVGARTQQDQGAILLYKGRSLTDWQLSSSTKTGEGYLGYMWECPDFFSIEQHSFLMFSPQGMAEKSTKYRNLFQSGYLAAQLRSTSEITVTGNFHELDYGHDFYAPQSFIAEDGRRIVFAWMDMWESPMPTKTDHWCGCFTLPREVRYNQATQQLMMLPIAELKKLRQQQYCIPVEKIDSTEYLLPLCARSTELNLCWDMLQSDAQRFGVTLGAGLRLFIDTVTQEIILDRHYPKMGLSSSRVMKLPATTPLKLQIFIDASSIELFINDGAATFSSRIYPEQSETVIALFASHGCAQLIAGYQWQLALES